MIARLLKGAFNIRPPVPRYSSTWDVQKVLNHLEFLSQPEDLSLKSLTLRTVFLMVITRPSRSADLTHLNMKRMRDWKLRGFLPSTVAKVTPRDKNSRVFLPLLSKKQEYLPSKLNKLLLGQNGAAKGWRTKAIPVLHQATQAGNFHNHCKMVTDSIRTGRNWLCSLWSTLY